MGLEPPPPPQDASEASRANKPARATDVERMKTPRFSLPAVSGEPGEFSMCRHGKTRAGSHFRRHWRQPPVLLLRARRGSGGSGEVACLHHDELVRLDVAVERR